MDSTETKIGSETHSDIGMRERILRLVGLVMHVPISELNDQSCSQNVKTWDSLTHMQLIVVLEQEFRIQFSMNDIVNTKNLGELIERIKCLTT